jgi:hypothetical protein
MTAATIAELTAALQESGAELSRLLMSVADRQDYRPDKQHWFLPRDRGAFGSLSGRVRTRPYPPDRRECEADVRLS